MTGPGFDANQVRLRAEVSSLKGSDILEGMAWHDAVVRVGGRGQDRGIIPAWHYVVVGRIGTEIAEIRLLRGVSEIGHPQLSAGEPVVAKHVHDADACKGSRKQVRALVDDGADEKAAAGFALDRQPSGGRGPTSFQIFAGGDEIVEDVLFFFKPARIVPRLAVFAAATNVGHRQHAALFHPGEPRGRPDGYHADTEAAIAIEQGRSGAGRVSPPDDEHRNARAVLGGVEALIYHDPVEVCIDLRCGPHLPCVRGYVVAVNRDGASKLVKTKKLSGSSGLPRNPPALPMPGSSTTPSGVPSSL